MSKNSQNQSTAHSQSPRTQPDNSVSASTPPSHQIPTPPSLQGAYQFIREIGHGSQATLFLAKRLADERNVVIKQLNIGSVKTWKEYELFQREAAVLKSLNIDGVAKFYDAIDSLDSDPPCSYIVQEYIEGASLADMIKSGHRLKVHDVYEIILQLLTILSQLHSMEPPVIHRDIKPSNIMISPGKDGSFKVTLIDFGAVANPQVQSGGSTVAGTFGYMPPEQLTGKPVPASDIYALAAVAVELFTGKSPAILPTKDFRIIFEPDMEQMQPELLNTLRKMLEPNVNERLTDITQIREIFTQFQNQQFTLISSENASSNYPKDFNQKLKKVESVGESGNMDIWQELPDNTPRYIPTPILNYYNHRTDKSTTTAKQPKNELRPNNSCLTTITVLIVLGGFIFLICFGSINPMTFSISVPLFFLLAFAIIRTRRNQNTTSDEELEDSNYKKPKINAEKLFKLINDGRKTVATITAIEYVPIEQSKAKYLPHNDIYLCHVSPCFRITYKFNPPDDAREEDLIHEYITHVDPQNYCKVGDPLPILYDMDRNVLKGREIVRSMPFPFPIEELDPDEVAFETQAELAHDAH